MATEVKIITLKQLGLYDGLVKKYINDADAKSIKSVKIEGRTLKFYKVEEPIGEDVLPAYSITIPETDLTEVNKAIKAVKDVVDKLDGEDTVEGSVKAQIKALKTEIEGQITASGYDDTEVKKSIKANTDAIGILNGTGDGSVDKKVADAVASIVADAPAAYDTLKEISDWISTHTEDASAMNSSIQTNKTDIANLAKLVGTLPEGDDAATIVAYIDKKVGAIDFSSAIATAKSEAISEAKKYTDGLAKNYATAEQGTKADTALQEADITDLKADVAANKASLGAEGATTKAIADAKKAGTDAQSNVDALAKRVDTIESTTYIEARANIGAQVAGSYASANHNHDDKYQAKGSYASASHTHTKSQITDFPTSMPANGGNSSTVNGHTVNADVPSGAKFTDTDTWRPQPDWNATSGDAVIKNKPTIPSVGNGIVTITQNGTSKGTFTMNQNGNTTIALTDTNTVTNIGTTASNYTNGNILIQGSGATTVSKSGNTVTISSTNTDTNTWRPLGTTADTACAGNDSRLSNARPASDVSAWAKASSKPSYTASEVGAAPANHSHSNYLTGITKSMVTSALGYTPPRVIVQSSEPAISTNDEWLLEY